MECPACNGTGDGIKKGDRNCSVCAGSGHICDVCGESCEPGATLCAACEDGK